LPVLFNFKCSLCILDAIRYMINDLQIYSPVSSLYFWGVGVWTQGLEHARQVFCHCAIHPALFTFLIVFI
jgi:hypothetical protein